MQTVKGVILAIPLKQYAYSIFNKIGFDSITVAPYMGRDSINPFIENKEKGAFVLCLTSNKSAEDFQFAKINNGMLYEHVAKVSVSLNIRENIGLVVGATNKHQMDELRDISPKLPWLIPGIGAQGGDLEASISIGNRNAIGIVNVSRGILYAGDGSLDTIVNSAQNYTDQIRKVFMTSKKLLELLEDSGAILNGHFLLTSGRHSNRYIEKFRVLEKPFELNQVCKEMAEPYKKQNVEIVLGAAIGGILIAGGVGRHLLVLIIFLVNE